MVAVGLLWVGTSQAVGPCSLQTDARCSGGAKSSRVPSCSTPAEDQGPGIVRMGSLQAQVTRITLWDRFPPRLDSKRRISCTWLLGTPAWLNCLAHLASWSTASLCLPRLAATAPVRPHTHWCLWSAWGEESGLGSQEGLLQPAASGRPWSLRTRAQPRRTAWQELCHEPQPWGLSQGTWCVTTPWMQFIQLQAPTQPA